MATLLQTDSTYPSHLEKDRRRSPRKPHVVDAWLASPTATDESERMEVESMDLSRHGVSFTLPRPVPTATFYVIEIGFGEQRIVSEVRIISCSKEESGKFRVGAAFC